MKIRSKIDRLIDNPDTSVKAAASITLDGVFAVHGFRVIQGKDKLFVRMTSVSYTDKDGNTQYSDIFHGITKSAYEAIQTSVMNAYHTAIEQSQSSEVEISEDEQPDEDMDEQPETDLSMQ
jgi:stage V sporulation protein G